MPDEPSASELLLFGGRMRYDWGWARHEMAGADVTFLAVARDLPGFLRLAVRMTVQADRRALVALVVAEVLRAVAGALALLATNWVLTGLLADGDVTDRLRTAAPAIATVACATGMATALGTVSSWAAGRLEPKVFGIATASYLQVVSRAELAAVEDPEFLKIVDSARFGAMSIQRLVGQATFLLTALLGLASAGSILTVLHPALLPMLVLITAPRGWSAVRVARARYASTKAWLQHSRASGVLADVLMRPHSAAELRVHNSGPFLLHHFVEMARSAEREQARLAGAKARTDLLGSTLAGLGFTAAYGLLGLLLSTGGMDLAVAATAIVAIRTGTASIGNIVTQINDLYEEGLFVRDLAELQREGEKRAIPTGGVPLPERPEVITVENVTYTYDGRDTPALENVTLTIRQGEVTALVGANGSGKSTLVKLLSGVYQPDGGKILWDEVSIAEGDRDQLFASVTLLAQDFQRWPFTLGTNVRLGRPEQPLTEGQLDASADYADLHPVIGELKNGWDTLVAKGFEGGVQLSGGQWQKTALTRTHLRSTTTGPDGRLPHLVIVDEPTSAMDAQTEVAAFERIRQLTELGATVVLITHRLAATAKADRIYVLDHGRLIEQGTHAELMAQQPTTRYRHDYLLQASQYETTPLPGQRRPQGEHEAATP
ncbi:MULTISPECIES: ABC transporter ATP-binding protein [unclassified Kitasatospora]|uniref:ATP-binding cassette domain-containing protein n=1 Tax=unclassified Kitasatospora TaxID=2633591 RepID=UPI00071484F6|nr:MULTISPECIES: ABC transporter ATP-binding protein [unclassified Kitasatospora]KQV20830.1 hypothetical protein ASC99_20185 [Kitasatospora sp. Root107]KRB60513.1 hypothetical protein ASE03_12990 [Kitasatospora sp. Root187]